MSFYLENEEPFVKKIKSLYLDSLNNNKVRLTRFLNIREQELVKYIVSTKDGINLFFSNIYENEEYKRAVITPFNKNIDFKISILKLIYPKKYLDISHRLILGSLLSLQIERDLIGDILISNDKNCYILVCSEIKDFIINEFRVLSHQPVSIEEIDEINDTIEVKYDILETFVSSLRLDLIISERLKLSRKESQDLIIKGFVKVNQKEITNSSHIIKENDIISVKGYGRIKLLEVGGLSKRDKIHVKIGKLL